MSPLKETLLNASMIVGMVALAILVHNPAEVIREGWFYGCGGKGCDTGRVC